MRIKVVQADRSDAATIAQLHAQSWQASYRGILPDAFLQNEVTGERTAYWSNAMSSGDYALALVAETDDGPAGFIAIKEGSEAGYDVTIEHLHVVPGMQGRGLGSRLMAEALLLLVAGGTTSTCLRVFDDNTKAIAYYQGLGGMTDSYGTDKLGGGDAPDRRIGWHDLAALLCACRAKASP